MASWDDDVRDRTPGAWNEDPPDAGEEMARKYTPAKRFLSGVNRGLAGLLDLPSKPLTMGANLLLEAAGTDARVNPAPFTTIGQEMGAITPEEPATLTGRVGQSLGSSALPGAGLAYHAGRVAPSALATAPRLSPVVRGAATAPGRTAGAELAAATTAGVGAHVGSSYGPTGEAVGAAAGGLTPAAATGGFRRLARGGEEGRRRLQDKLAIPGLPSPSAGVGSQAPGAKTFEQAVATLPGGGTVMRNRMDEVSEGFREASDRIVDQLATRRSPEMAGRAVEEGVSAFTGDFRARATRLYNRVNVPPETPVSLTRTQTLLDEVAGEIEGAEKFSKILANPKLRQMAEAVYEAESLPYEAARKLRSQIGRQLTSVDLVADIPRAELKRLYGALSEDIKETARAVSPEAAKAQSRADRYWSMGLERIDNVLEPLIKSGVPERAYNAVVRADPSTIRRIRRSISPAQWKVVQAEVIDKLGRATPGQQNVDGIKFSPGTFLTNWNRLGDRRRELLGVSPRLERELDRLARAVGDVKASEQWMPNPSGTARGALLAGSAYVASTGAEGLAQTAGLILGNYATAKMLTNPRTVRWLAETTRVPITQLPYQIDKLVEMAETLPPDVGMEVVDLLQGVQ